MVSLSSNNRELRIYLLSECIFLACLCWTLEKMVLTSAGMVPDHRVGNVR